VGYVINNQKPRRVEFTATHNPTSYIQFLFGGQTPRVRGFNGQFANIVFGVGKGRFVSKHDQIQKLYSQRSTIPKSPSQHKRIDIPIEKVLMAIFTLEITKS
jgi:hypothetical protein